MLNASNQVFPLETMEYILDGLRQDTLQNNGYEDLVGLGDVRKYYGTRWTELEHEKVQRTLGIFATTISGVTGREVRDDLNTREGFRRLVIDWKTMPQEVRNSSFLHYQSIKDGLTADMEVSKFMEFGVPQKANGGLDQRIRVYVDAPHFALPLFAEYVVAEYAATLRTVPHLKFRESSTKPKYQDRSDGLVVFTSTPDELTAALSGIKKLHDWAPNWLSERGGVVLGEVVEIQGERIPAIRLGQDPPELGVSYNQQRASIFSRIGYEFQGRADEPYLEEKIAYYYAKNIAPELGLRPDNSAYNLSQDLNVIRRAIAAV